jgi:hypothetical protein
MIQLPDFLIGFCNRTNMTSNQTQGDDNASKLDPAEYGPLSYIAGYIVSKLYQKNSINLMRKFKFYCML